LHCAGTRAGKHSGDTSRSLYERANGYNYDAVKIFMPGAKQEPPPANVDAIGSSLVSHLRTSSSNVYLLRTK
jgi:hypothetical protein